MVGDTPAVRTWVVERKPARNVPEGLLGCGKREESEWGFAVRGHSCGSDLGGGAETSPECPRGASWLWEEGGDPLSKMAGDSAGQGVNGLGNGKGGGAYTGASEQGPRTGAR
jgi:hypothetical protein